MYDSSVMIIASMINLYPSSAAEDVAEVHQHCSLTTPKEGVTVVQGQIIPSLRVLEHGLSQGFGPISTATLIDFVCGKLEKYKPLGMELFDLGPQ